MIDRSIRHVALVLMACFVLLFVQLNRIQVFDADELRNNPNNTRTVQRDFGRARGAISTRDGVVVAQSDLSPNSGFERLRVYPEGELYAHVTGYLSFNLGTTGVERTYNDELAGRTSGLQLSSLSDLLGEVSPTGEIVLTLDHTLQQRARELLGERNGSIVALDPRTGEIRAMYSWPSYDPNLLSGHNGAEVNAAFRELVGAEGNPLRAKTYREIYFPGSTFKIVTGAAALETGVASLESPSFAVTNSYTPPLTDRAIANFGGSACGGPLIELIRVSCNAGFAQLGAEVIGPDRLVEQAQGFGFNLVPPIDLPDATASRFPTDYGSQLREPSLEMPAGIFENSPALAQASIGQNEVAATPLQMALVAAAVANEGQILEPRVVLEVRNVKGEVIDTPNPQGWLTATSRETADELREAMINSARNGTGNRALVEGLDVGTKTGTAQLGTTPARSHAWTIAFAGPRDGTPELVIAVLIEADPENPEQTGGRAAAPIVGDLIRTAFGR